MKAQYVTVEDVSDCLGISKSKAYQIIRRLNNELKEKGYITIAGKCPVRYFEKNSMDFKQS